MEAAPAAVELQGRLSALGGGPAEQLPADAAASGVGDAGAAPVGLLALLEAVGQGGLVAPAAGGAELAALAGPGAAGPTDRALGQLAAASSRPVLVALDVYAERWRHCFSIRRAD